MRDLSELRAELRDAENKQNTLLNERQNLEARRQAGDDTDGVQERIARVNAGITNADARKTEIEAEIGRQVSQLDHIREAAQDPRNCERAFDTDNPRISTTGNVTLAGKARDAGMRTVERFVKSGELRSDAADRLDGVLRRDDDGGLTSRWLEAVGDPHYATAFGKLLADPTTGHLRHTPEEQRAMQRVAQVQAQERAMSVGTTTAGGFATPFTLDPSIINTSNGATNPVRDVARVITVGTGTWKGISSDGVTAAFSAEAAEASDGSPTLAQPVIKTEKWNVFVPVSIELAGDWGTLQQELTTLITDARDVLEATKFLTGSGSDEPFGVLTGATTTVGTASSGTFVVADPWTLKAAIPARFLGNTTFAAAPAVWDTIYRFVGTNSTEPLQMPSREGSFLGRPKIEWSTMSTSTTSGGAKILVGGDFRAGYVIADRIGTTVEIIQHLFGGSQRPTGQRGIYVYGRTGAKVVATNAFRTLVVK